MVDHKGDEARIRIDRPTYVGTSFSETKVPYTEFLRDFVSEDVPDFFSKRRYNDILPGSSREEYAHAASLSKKDVEVRWRAFEERRTRIRDPYLARKSSLSLPQSEKKGEREYGSGDDPLLPVLE